MILTNARGNPLDPPTPPAPDAPIDDVIVYLRASAAHNDRVAALASRAFVRSFHVADRAHRKYS